MKNKKTKKLLACFHILVLGFFVFGDLAYAEVIEESAPEAEAPVVESEAEVEAPVTYPYKDIFKITAYYSPLEGQERYVTGSYAGDIRLNGSGVRSADGTPVYPGMIAAPKTYPFGMKMRIPGIGTVAVHDRGGAIVTAGNRNQSYDRLDVWMGYGDIGLSRALNWGARIVDVTVFGIDNNIEPSVYLEGFSEAEKFVRSVIASPKTFTHDIWYGTTGKDVEKLQEFLKNLGYFNDPINGFFGESTQQAVLEFQIDYDVVTSIEDFGAGHFGPQTRLKIEAVHSKREETKLPDKSLGVGADGDDVKFLQESLKKLVPSKYGVKVFPIYHPSPIDFRDSFYRTAFENQIRVMCSLINALGK